MVPFCLGRLFVLRPVGGGGEGGPGFGGGAEVGVAVGGLLDIEVVPAGGISVVLPGLHAGEEGARGLRGAAGGAVDHGHELSAGDGLVGAEGAVGVAVDPAEICGQGDGVRGPVARGDVREVDRGGLLLGELRQHGGELGAGDGVIGAEIAGAAVGDGAGVVEGGDVGVIPLGGIDVAEAGGGGIVEAAGVGVHEAEEDGRDLGPGDAARGLDRPVGIALHIGEVIARVELGGFFTDGKQRKDTIRRRDLSFFDINLNQIDIVYCCLCRTRPKVYKVLCALIEQFRRATVFHNITIYHH